MLNIGYLWIVVQMYIEKTLSLLTSSYMIFQDALRRRTGENIGEIWSTHGLIRTRYNTRLSVIDNDTEYGILFAADINGQFSVAVSDLGFTEVRLSPYTYIYSIIMCNLFIHLKIDILLDSQYTGRNDITTLASILIGDPFHVTTSFLVYRQQAGLARRKH